MEQKKKETPLKDQKNIYNVKQKDIEKFQEYLKKQNKKCQ